MDEWQQQYINKAESRAWEIMGTETALKELAAVEVAQAARLDKAKKKRQIMRSTILWQRWQPRGRQRSSWKKLHNARI